MKKSTLAFLLFIGPFSLISCSHGHHRGMGHNQMWEMMDANKDGQVTKDEFNKAHEEAFNTMDTNKDGVISADEKASCHKQNNACHKKMEKQ